MNIPNVAAQAESIEQSIFNHKASSIIGNYSSNFLRSVAQGQPLLTEVIWIAHGVYNGPLICLHFMTVREGVHEITIHWPPVPHPHQ